MIFFKRIVTYFFCSIEFIRELIILPCVSFRYSQLFQAAFLAAVAVPTIYQRPYNTTTFQLRQHPMKYLRQPIPTISLTKIQMNQSDIHYRLLKRRVSSQIRNF